MWHSRNPFEDVILHPQDRLCYVNVEKRRCCWVTVTEVTDETFSFFHNGRKYKVSLGEIGKKFFYLEFQVHDLLFPQSMPLHRRGKEYSLFQLAFQDLDELKPDRTVIIINGKPYAYFDWAFLGVSKYALVTYYDKGKAVNVNYDRNTMKFIDNKRLYDKLLAENAPPKRDFRPLSALMGDGYRENR